MINKIMSDLRRINELSDLLYNELVEQGLWEGFKSINHFSKSEYSKSLEERVAKLEKENRAFRDLGFQREQAVKRFRKLDLIHECTCEGCTNQRTKFNALVEIIETADRNNGIPVILGKA